MRETILLTLARWHARQPWRMLGVAAALTLFFGFFASRLSISTHTSDLLPAKSEKVIQFNRVLDEFKTATNMVIVVQGEEAHIKRFADDLAPRLLELRDSGRNTSYRERIDDLRLEIVELELRGGRAERIAGLNDEIRSLESRIDNPLYQRVDYKSDIDFLREHALMLVKAEDLENTKDMFMNPNLVGFIKNLNDSLEKEYVGQEESLSTREQEDQAWGFLDGVQGFVAALRRAAESYNLSEAEVQGVIDELILGEPYFLSYDERALVLNAVPTFTIMERDYIMIATQATQAVLDDLLKEYPGVEAGLSGAIAKEHDEQVASTESMGMTTLVAFVFILALLVISFRMWVAPLFAISNLVVGLIWAFGTAGLVVGQLNMLTSVMSVVLLGLGIDFSIHFFSGFTEWRARGDSIELALEKTFLKNGKGIITGGLTTSCAFLTLVISSARGMKEMGLVAGLGLLAILLATLLFLPLLLVFRERRVDRRREDPERGTLKPRRNLSYGFLGAVGEWLGRHRVPSLLAVLAVSVVLVWSALKIEWDMDFRNMEPKGLMSIQLVDTVLEKFDLSMDYALVLAEDVEESRRLAEAYRDIASVAQTNDISLFLPSPEEQRARIPHIEDIRDSVSATALKTAVTERELTEFKEEIARLEMNIIEIQDMAFLGGRDKVDDKCTELVGDPDGPEARSMIQELLVCMEGDLNPLLAGMSRFQAAFAPRYQSSILRMCSTESIQMEDLPPSLLDQYANRDRDLFLITVYPQGTIYERDFFYRFVEDLERVSDKATGAPPLFISLIRILGREGRNAVLLTLVIVFVLLAVDFRSPKEALAAMIPLAFGLFWMVGFMNLAGINLSIMTVIGLPLIVGIGIDDGVHVMHRWKNEGSGRIRTVFASTGKAILLTSLTTMLAFGSMVFSVFPAWGLFGGALFLGVAACFLTTVGFLPGILSWFDRKTGGTQADASGLERARRRKAA
jgi:predicted RND superfamily exporter protein